MSWAASPWVQRLLPQCALSGIVYRLARTSNPLIAGPLIRWFAHRYRVDLAEADEPDLSRYPTFNAFFTRALKPAARPLEGDEGTLVSPVDGRLAEFGVAENDRLIQAKGVGYPLHELLGESTSTAAPFAGASFATFYLAPHNYHRVHMPLAGRLTRTRYVPGRRFSVNPVTVAGMPGLLCRNERLACWFETDSGLMAMVLVGALNVSSISTVWLGEIESGRARLWADSREHAYRRGQEMARFNLGSTVVVLCSGDALQWDQGLYRNMEVRMGARVADLLEAGKRSAQR